MGERENISNILTRIETTRLEPIFNILTRIETIHEPNVTQTRIRLHLIRQILCRQIQKKKEET